MRGNDPEPHRANNSSRRQAVRVGHDGLLVYRAHREKVGSDPEPLHFGPDPDGHLGSIDDGRIYVEQESRDNGSSYVNRMTGNMWLEPSDSGLLIGLDMPL